VFAVMIWIRVRRADGEGAPAGGRATPSCALCGEQAISWSYDGLDPHEQHDPYTGKAWSPDAAHYRPVCAAH
jgi:hypothetical protein